LYVNYKKNLDGCTVAVDDVGWNMLEQMSRDHY